MRRAVVVTAKCRCNPSVASHGLFQKQSLVTTTLSNGIACRRIKAQMHPIWANLEALLPIEDSTESADRSALPAVTIPASGNDRLLARPDPYDAVARTLHRARRGNVLLTGLKGVGKTTHVRELARRAAAGEIPFLAGHRFLWIDCQNVGPEDSRACLESIFTAVAELVPPVPPQAACDEGGGAVRGRGSNDARTGLASQGIVLCLDGLGALLKRPNGGTNKPLLRALISRSGVRLIGILSRWEYNDLIGGDVDMADLFMRIEIEEPNEQTALAIARRHAARLSAEFNLRIDDRVVERTVALASTFILNECHPAKSIRILQRVCEDADYDRTQLGIARTEITVEDVVRAMAEKTGIPPHTIAGESDDVPAGAGEGVTAGGSGTDRERHAGIRSHTLPFRCDSGYFVQWKRAASPFSLTVPASPTVPLVPLSPRRPLPPECGMPASRAGTRPPCRRGNRCS
jgi:hypothetical protein